MGTYLGKRHINTGLSGTADNVATGASTGAVVGNVIPIPGVGAGIGAGVGAVTGLVYSLVGGGSSCSGTQKEQRKQLAKLIEQVLTYSERQQLVSGMESDIAPTGQDMAYFFFGGKDCKHKNVTPGDQQFLDELPKVVEQRAKEAQQKQQLNSESDTNKPVSQPPANMAVTGGGINPAAKYFLIGTGIVGLGAVGYVAYNKYQKN